MGQKDNNRYKVLRTTIGLKKSTKTSLDRYRAPGQSYDGFVRQLLSLWKTLQKENQSTKSATGEKQSASDD